MSLLFLFSHNFAFTLRSVSDSQSVVRRAPGPKTFPGSSRSGLTPFSCVCGGPSEAPSRAVPHEREAGCALERFEEI